MGMQSSKDVEEFKEEVFKWAKMMKTVDSVIEKWVKCQKDYIKLRPIFLDSDDIKQALPEETKRFEKVDADFQSLMRDAQDEPKVTECAGADGREALLVELQSEINYCEKQLNDYLEEKKKMFPRFYFVSNQALLEILSNGMNPRIVDTFLGDCFDGLKSINLKPQDMSDKSPMQGRGMFDKTDEYVPFTENFICQGAVETYLSALEIKMQDQLREILVDAKETTEEWLDKGKEREVWLERYVSQLALLATQIVWTEETNRAFEDLESGSEGAMKENFELIKNRITKLIDRVREDLSSELRVKIITIITIDVHSRDVIEMFVEKKIPSAEHFDWLKQLKFYLENKKEKKDLFKSCESRICDWRTWYTYEFVGNTGRLVITPLTDRCYITLSQALNLSMGGAPAGPAGTGKTETTKDLARALGL
jgi:dynein heavy chain, axonemal